MVQSPIIIPHPRLCTRALNLNPLIESRKPPTTQVACANLAPKCGAGDQSRPELQQGERWVQSSAQDAHEQKLGFRALAV